MKAGVFTVFYCCLPKNPVRQVTGPSFIMRKPRLTKVSLSRATKILPTQKLGTEFSSRSKPYYCTSRVQSQLVVWSVDLFLSGSFVVARIQVLAAHGRALVDGGQVGDSSKAYKLEIVPTSRFAMRIE